MKTTNNVQKAILKSLAVMVSFVLISFAVSAQGFWETLLENDTFNEIAYAMVESNSETNVASEDASSSTDMDAFISLNEEALELEDWMTSDANFVATFNMEEAEESPLQMENWMTNNFYFVAPVMSVEVEAEEALDLESWMFDSENFVTENQNTEVAEVEKYITGRNFILVNDQDDELELENWMVDNKTWEN